MPNLVINLTRKWVSALTRLKAVTSTIGPDGIRECSLSMRALEHEFHPDVKAKVWGYVDSSSPTPNLHYAGPIIETQLTGSPGLRVLWRNELTNQFLGKAPNNVLAFGARVGMEEAHMLAKSHNQVHMHGARVPGTSDGNPMETFHPREAHGFSYPNQQPGALLWFHDHAMDVTRLNVYAGLYGAHLLRDPSEAALLPTGKHEIVMILGDRSFTDSTGGLPIQLFYEQPVDFVAAKPSEPAHWEATPEFAGDYPVVNGKIWPKHNVEPTFQRFRLANGANARIFQLSFFDGAVTPTKIPFDVIGSDGGFLIKPDHRTQGVHLAPGERLDIVVDFSSHAGQQIFLGTPGEGPEFRELVRFDVAATLSGSPAPYAPASGGSLPARTDAITDPHFPKDSHFVEIAEKVRAVTFQKKTAIINPAGLGPLRMRRFILIENRSQITGTLNTAIKSPGGVMTVALPAGHGAIGNDVTVPMIVVNGKSGNNTPRIKIKKDAMEVWEFINHTVDSHPMHIHLVQFRAIERRSISGANVYGTKHNIAEYEHGWKDTIVCLPDQSTQVLMRFDGEIGDYVYHCHILEHEDMGMMGAFTVE